MADRYDVIVIGSGAGGGTLAHTLAPSGSKAVAVAHQAGTCRFGRESSLAVADVNRKAHAERLG